MHIQDGREISAIIVTDDYICYKEPKNPYNFFLFKYLTNYLSLKLRTNCNIERRGPLLCTARTSTFSLRSHKDPFAFFTTLPRRSDQKISMKCYLILRKIFLKIILHPRKINRNFVRIISNDISSAPGPSQMSILI